ncbi:Uncharacterised protein [Peptostreptococcus anaerobius]|uniref:Uncharacterized protein n=1 Tax=Peptostreptococcus anaerobius TaxID=1261 RepID=A0A379CK81_9FIRM|nr:MULTISPECIES: hypothetical protein [Peptostreptococcus]MDU5350021.1 hypothetical protein [Peptostreptococcus sp.]MDU5891511.1 hypothetical protein [Peptostreptococcus sp.]SFM87107.1 hypothetical protein SAMN05660467_00652 [Peptostreptococcus anaerobius]SUB60167.1 Uncharacterised protein [Peptostreptococcus anaerobius]SUB62156.1 Uncharacterised protein [Peptostreptococcus anaerobius]
MAKIIRNKVNNRAENNPKYFEIKRWINENEDYITAEVINLTTGVTCFLDSRTKERLEWNESGDTKIISMKNILSMLGSSRGLLKSLSLGIVEFFNTGEVYSFEEIIATLGLDFAYAPFDYNITNIDGLIIDSSLDEFDTFCNKLSIDILLLVFSRYLYLKSEGEINDKNKENILSNITGKGYLFENK